MAGWHKEGPEALVPLEKDTDAVSTKEDCVGEGTVDFKRRQD